MATQHPLGQHTYLHRLRRASACTPTGKVTQLACIAAAMFAAGLAAQPRIATAAPAVVYAEHVTWNPATRVLEAAGNVELLDGARWVRADFVTVAIEPGIISARGHVTWQALNAQGFADAATMDTRTRTGAFFAAEITGPDGTLIWGRRIEQTGPDSYVIHDGGFTPCACPEQTGAPAWKITVARADVTWRKRVRFRHGAFWLRRFPFLYTPAGIAPLTENRQSGILFPGLSYSARNGFGIQPGVFLALGRSADFTVWGEYTTLGGWGLTGEARAASARGTYLGRYEWFDEADDAPFLADEGRSAVRRWQLSLRMREKPADLLRLQLNVELQSDTRTKANLAEDLDDLSQNTTTSQLILSQEWDGIGAAMAQVGVSQRLLTAQASGSRIPSLWLRADPRRFGRLPLWVAADARYDEFFTYDETEGDPWVPTTYDHQGRRLLLGARMGAEVDPLPGLIADAVAGIYWLNRSRKAQTTALGNNEAAMPLATTAGVVIYTEGGVHWGTVYSGKRHQTTLRPGFTALWVSGHDSGQGPIEDIDVIADQRWLTPGLWAAGSAGTSATRMGWDYALRYPITLTGPSPDPLGIWIHDVSVHAGPASLQGNIWQDTVGGYLTRWAGSLVLRPWDGNVVTLSLSRDRGMAPYTLYDVGRPSPFVDDRLPWMPHTELLLSYNWELWHFFGGLVGRRRLEDNPGWVERSLTVGYRDSCDCWRIAVHAQDLPRKIADRIELRFELALIGGGTLDF